MALPVFLPVDTFPLALRGRLSPCAIPRAGPTTDRVNCAPLLSSPASVSVVAPRGDRGLNGYSTTWKHKHTHSSSWVSPQHQGEGWWSADLVRSGCCKHHRRGAQTTNIGVPPTVLETGKSEIRVPGGSGSSETPFRVADVCSRGGKLREVPLMRTLIPLMTLIHPHGLNISQRPRLQLPSPWG